MRKLLAFTLMFALMAFIGCGTKVEDDSAAETATDTTASEVAQDDTSAGDTSAGDTSAADTTAGETTAANVPTDASALTTKDSGVRYLDLVVGEGAEATDQMRVECHYTLWFSDSTGLVKLDRFQSSKDGGQPFVCVLGQRLITGWSDGMIGMKEGGTRQLHIPWALGYGEAGGGPIPAATNLIFEIEFLRKM
jgi:FKBP-type peptidyl-prolyl cis-trans isomerase FkpA